MVRRKIIWSVNALNDKLEILEYWYKKNGNLKYSRQLNSEFQNICTLLSFNYKLGKPFKNEIRYFIKRDLQIFYELKEDFIEILHIWDTRRNPKENPFA